MTSSNEVVFLFDVDNTVLDNDRVQDDIETDKAKIDEWSEEMDCSFLQGDGSQPNILREVDPAHTDVLYCLTDCDQANVIARLVGRSLGFKRIVTSIGNPQFEGICHELGLKDTITPPAQSEVTWRTWSAALKTLSFPRSSRTRPGFSP
jgi:TrkA-N domain